MLVQGPLFQFILVVHSILLDDKCPATVDSLDVATADATNATTE